MVARGPRPVAQAFTGERGSTQTGPSRYRLVASGSVEILRAVTYCYLLLRSLPSMLGSGQTGPVGVSGSRIWTPQTALGTRMDDQGEIAGADSRRRKCWHTAHGS